MSQTTRIIPLLAAGGAPVVIRCSVVATRMEIIETPGFEGLIAQDLTPTQFGNFTVGTAYTVQPDMEPLIFAGHKGDINAHAEPIGNGGSGGQPVAPGGPATIGTPKVQLTSASANTTSVRVTEWT